MSLGGWRAPLARFGAPIAFLAAVTVAVLLVRAGLDSGNSSNGSAPTVVSTPATPPTTTQSRGKTYYRIRSGDTLGAVAARFDTTVRALLTLNPGVRPSSLTIGQRLRVR